ncbi:50S ribosomal protein L31 [Gloeomargaritales cyanobacterium VI4D9]|nr:50S ribosomal protein L31 [Gloeomargaritales cyanobacterium VI4D9]
MPKPGIHPEWYPEAKVFCNGEVVMTVGSTKPQLHVDIWSGNHPFYTGTQKIIDTEGRVERFMRKYSKPASTPAKSKTPEKGTGTPAQKAQPKPARPTKKK